MASTTGWFIDLKSGEIIRIFEHIRAIRQDPTRYRTTADELAGKSRGEGIHLVLKKGFVRVRHTGPEVHLEFDHEHSSAFASIKSFLRSIGNFGPLTLLVIKDHNKKQSLRCNLEDLDNSDELSWQPFGDGR